MPVQVCGKRFRGSWSGIFGLSFILFCWCYATYCMLCIVTKHFFDAGNIGNLVFYGYSVLATLTLLSLLQASQSDAGKVYAISDVMSGTLGWEMCDTCEKAKPPRSHHCSKCGRCSRKMDHHCIWINNCVGEDNLGIFIRFTCYALLQVTLTGLCCINYYWNIFGYIFACTTCLPISVEDVKMIQIQMFCLSFFMACLFIFLTGMMVDRCLLVAADMTTIEMMKNRPMLRARIRDPANPGFIKTFIRTFGTENFFLWFIPCCCESPIIPEHDRAMVTNWSNYYKV